MLRRCRVLAVIVSAALGAGAAVALVVLPATAEAVPTGSYTAVTPTRLLDTRSSSPVAGHGSVTFVARGAGTPVSSSATAVLVNITVTEPGGPGYVTAYADGGTLPTAADVNFVRGATVPGLVLAPIGADGRVRVYNGSASPVQVIADVSGYLAPSTSAAPPQGAIATVAPTRLLDTRSGAAVAGHGSVSFAATGTHGGVSVPAGVSAVLVNVTATDVTAAGYITAYADGASRPTAANLNIARGQTVGNLVVAPVGSDGRVRLYNGSAGTVDLVADLQGYVLAGDPIGAGTYGALSPSRLLDTRTTHTALQAGGTLTLSVGGRAGVPRSGVSAVALNVTAVNPSSVGYLTVYSGARPGTANINFVRGQTVPNLVFAPVSGGTVTIYNGSHGTVDVVADVSGYVQSTDLVAPVVSTSRYVRTTDASTLAADGAADAASGSKLVLLDIGAQLNNKTGVELTGTNAPVSYADLVTALNAYLAGFGSVAGATVAVGTNNDASDWTTYPASARGADWANKVIDQLTPGAGVTIAGADDIEAGFVSTEAQAEQWESAFLANTSAPFVYNGSADGCPYTYGATGGTCNQGWTEAQYYRLTGGLSPTRIRVLPQVYYPSQAVQWANIDATGGGNLVFAGSLTEFALDSTTFSPLEGWAALRHALGTVVTSPSLPAATDITVS